MEQFRSSSSASPIHKEKARNIFSQKQVEDHSLPDISLKHWMFQATGQNPEAPKSV